MHDTEDGLFSRFLFYAFSASPVWISQFEDSTDRELDEALALISRRLDDMHRGLSAREVYGEDGGVEPLYLVLEDEQRALVDRAFSEMQGGVFSDGRTELMASVKRGAFHAVRIAGVLAAYRLVSTGANLRKLTSYQPTRSELDAAIALVRCYLDHARLLALAFAKDPAAALETEERQVFLARLPECFETGIAHAIGASLGMSRSGVERALKALTDRHGLLTRTRRGQYSKVAPDDPASGLLEATEVTEATEAMEVAVRRSFASVAFVESVTTKVGDGITAGP